MEGIFDVWNLSIDKLSYSKSFTFGEEAMLLSGEEKYFRFFSEETLREL